MRQNEQVEKLTVTIHIEMIGGGRRKEHIYQNTLLSEDLEYADDGIQLHHVIDQIDETHKDCRSDTISNCRCKSITTNQTLA